jgi:hypothetical protein
MGALKGRPYTPRAFKKAARGRAALDGRRNERAGPLAPLLRCGEARRAAPLVRPLPRCLDRATAAPEVRPYERPFAIPAASRDVLLEATLDLMGEIICPSCGTRTSAEMPVDACLFFFECPGCKTLLRPKEGDCCVFCSYGAVKCPPRIVGLGRE